LNKRHGKSNRVSTSGGLEIPQGNTTPGVNQVILLYLLKETRANRWQTLLDIPCGHGHFVTTVNRYSEIHAVGADLLETPRYLSEESYFRIDAANPPTANPQAQKYDVVSCISGVMEFGNTTRFVEYCCELLKGDGAFIITNDSIFTVQDRLLYLLLGRTRRIKLCRTMNRSVWNLIPMPTLVGILHGAGFEIENIVHVLRKPKDLWMVPFAIALYPLLYVYLHWSMFFEKRELPSQLRKSMYPLRSLYCAHYIVFCRKRVASPESSSPS
jgi:hypothetical protein